MLWGLGFFSGEETRLQECQSGAEKDCEKCESGTGESVHMLCGRPTGAQEAEQCDEGGKAFWKKKFDCKEQEASQEETDIGIHVSIHYGTGVAARSNDLDRSNGIVSIPYGTGVAARISRMIFSAVISRASAS